MGHLAQAPPPLYLLVQYEYMHFPILVLRYSVLVTISELSVFCSSSCQSRLATTAELELVHDPEYVRWVDELAHMSHDGWVERERQTDGVPLNGHTPRAARLAAGCLLQVLDAVLEGRASNGFALIRYDFSSKCVQWHFRVCKYCTVLYYTLLQIK